MLFLFQAKIIFFDCVSVGHILNRFSSDVGTVDDSLPFMMNILLAVFFSVLGECYNLFSVQFFSVCSVVITLPSGFDVSCVLEPSDVFGMNFMHELIWKDIHQTATYNFVLFSQEF